MSKIVLCLAVVAALAVPAMALPENASKLTAYGNTLRFSVNFAGFELDYGTGLGSGAHIGYSPTTTHWYLMDAARNVIGETTQSGGDVAGKLNFVTTINAGNNAFVYGVGTVDNIQNPDGTVVAQPQTYPAQAGATTQQMTFVVDDFGIQNIQVGVLGSPQLIVTYKQNSGMMYFVEDATTDAEGDGGFDASAETGAPAGELPTAYFDFASSTYFDNIGAEDSDFSFRNPSDPAEDDVLILTHTGNLQSTNVFNMGQLTTVFGAADGTVTDVWVSGNTNFTNLNPFIDPLSVVGGQWVDMGILDPDKGFDMTAPMAFGKIPGQLQNTGVDPWDTATFTFQTPPAGGPEVFGGTVVLIPEPVSMIALLLGSGGLVGYLRRRRA